MLALVQVIRLHVSVETLKVYAFMVYSESSGIVGTNEGWVRIDYKEENVCVVFRWYSLVELVEIQVRNRTCARDARTVLIL
jgi:hypothetical protein